jgi:hypothetical protein
MRSMERWSHHYSVEVHMIRLRALSHRPATAVAAAAGMAEGKTRRNQKADALPSCRPTIRNPGGVSLNCFTYKGCRQSARCFSL